MGHGCYLLLAFSKPVNLFTNTVQYVYGYFVDSYNLLKK